MKAKTYLVAAGDVAVIGILALLIGDSDTDTTSVGSLDPVDFVGLLLIVAAFILSGVALAKFITSEP